MLLFNRLLFVWCCNFFFCFHVHCYDSTFHSSMQYFDDLRMLEAKSGNLNTIPLGMSYDNKGCIRHPQGQPEHEEIRQDLTDRNVVRVFFFVAWRCFLLFSVVLILLMFLLIIIIRLHCSSLYDHDSCKCSCFIV